MEKDYKEIGSPTVMDIFNKAIAKKGQEYAKAFKPFDEPCARLDFRDKVEAMQKESERRLGFVDDNLQIDIGDLDIYGAEDRFELLDDQEAYVDKVIEGSRTQVIIGHTFDYRCKTRGHGISVFVPMREYLEMQEAKSKKKRREE